MRITRRVVFLFLVAAALLMAANAAQPVAWAASADAPLGQTVPTRTSTPGPATPPPPATHPAQPTAPADPTGTAEGAPSMLPVAGHNAESDLSLIVGMGGGLLLLAIALRRRESNLRG